MTSRKEIASKAIVLSQQASAKMPITLIKEGQEYQESGPQHFCYHNHLVPGWTETWTRIQIQVCSPRELKVTVVQDEEELQELEHFSLWTFVRYFMRERSNETLISVGLFSTKTCFRVDPADRSAKYTVRVAHKLDIYLFLIFLSGLLLFLYADTLSRSQVFYYSAGMSTGMIASLIILIFLMARLLPRLILKEHWHLAIGYIAVVGFISFAVCYRHGPLVEERSINILSWTLQIFGLLLVYAGIQVQQVALAIIVAAFCAKNLEYPVQLAIKVYRKLRPNWCRKLEPRRLLTEEEYIRQGEEETQRALEDLRQYCGSPDFQTWKAVSRLQSPKRFADFMEGSPHLMGNEVSLHTQEYGLGWYELFATDEEDEEEVEEEEEEEVEHVLKTEELNAQFRNHRGQ
ncbi:hypothetical protein GJAV_G00193850 [Gymnothorax javanicus]|nr:hypothetical protein GJAV_G00193850 [Gymnothorax javanicus]